MAADLVILPNFATVFVLVFLLTATVKVILMSRGAVWDGWSLIAISLALLSVYTALGALEQFGLFTVTIRALSAAVSGLAAASAFILATRIIKGAKRAD